MKVTDLRIGNYIMDTEYPERECRVFRLTCGTDFSITYSYGKCHENSYANDRMNPLQPVPLTGEWLLKFGFEATDKLVFFDKEYKWKICDYRIHWIFFKHSEIETSFITTLKYVHQLQNLYFVLTGNELTIL